jgi:hypothetical protein
MLRRAARLYPNRDAGIRMPHMPFLQSTDARHPALPAIVAGRAIPLLSSPDKKLLDRARRAKFSDFEDT